MGSLLSLKTLNALQVSLMVPWIAEVDQKVLFKDHVSFETPEDQVSSCIGFGPLGSSVTCACRRSSAQHLCCGRLRQR